MHARGSPQTISKGFPCIERVTDPCGVECQECIVSQAFENINIDSVNQGLGSINQGFGASGTGSGPLESINDPISRVHFYFR